MGTKEIAGYYWARLGVVVCHLCSQSDEWDPEGSDQPQPISWDELKKIDDDCYECDVPTSHWIK